MKIVLTGSLGNISKPLAKALIAAGHSVTVVSSNIERKNDIEALGAKAAHGNIEDTGFLTQTITGADAVFCLTPPNFSAPDQMVYYETIAHSFTKAIQQSGIKRVVYVSSYGAHLPSGTGFISGSYRSEKILNALQEVHLTYLRPTYFYYNLFPFIGMIKHAGFIGSVYGDDDKMYLVSPKDIAVAAAEELVKISDTKKVRYVCSDERTCAEIAHALGNVIGLPDLKWKTLPPDQVKQSLLKNGLSENAASNLVELGIATHNGWLAEDYLLNKPSFGKIKLEDFATDFAVAYDTHESTIKH